MTRSLSLARALRWAPLARALRFAPLALFAAALAAPPAGAQQTSVPANLNDFLIPGTQPNALNVPIIESTTCAACHGNYNYVEEPYRRWAASMMGQAGRDPIFYAALTIANQDVDFGGELCLRCHAPGAWLAGRSTPSNGSALDPSLGDLDGVTCHFCHRMVDPIFSSENPADDPAILAALPFGALTDPHSGSYVIDPDDNRRGPFDLGQFFYHNWRESPFHRESLMCATCHDVSNPLLERQPNGSWQLGSLGQAHPTANKHDMFPVERTYSEWSASVFAVDEIDMGGRFGGANPNVASCQDCHLPDLSATACVPGLGAPQRPDMPQHDFNGANSWVLRAVRVLFPDNETGLTAATVDDALARNRTMLQNAADLEVIERGGRLLARVTNQSGHKLPTGYGEGRRMWLNVRFFAGATLIAERGHYDYATADLTTGDTTVYEIEHGIDAQMSSVTGVPAGKSFHFLLNNVTRVDNRIPARGYRAARYDALGAGVYAAAYDEEQYWSEVEYDVPAGATRAEVRLFHQTTSKEYITFLRDENVTDHRGRDAYRLWEYLGKSEPVEMGLAQLDLAVAECLEPRVLALGKARAGGARPELRWNGEPSRTASNFALTVAGGVPGQLAVVFESDAQASLDHAGGTLNLAPGMRRVAVVALDANGAATIPIGYGLAQPGQPLVYQVFFRDPQDPFGIGMTGGLRVDVCE